MDATSSDLEQALLQCADNFGLSKPVKSWKDLQDGHLFWEMLKVLDPGHFTGELPENELKTGDSWISRWQNREHAHSGAGDSMGRSMIHQVSINKGLPLT